MNREQLQKDIHAREHMELSPADTQRLLDSGRKYQLAPVLQGGVLVFPHAGVKDCGHLIAACVHACLDSGAERVIVISVLHAFTDAMEQARQAVATRAPPSDFPTWGIQGEGLDFRDEWRGDHALIAFRHFWHAEVARRGSKPPELIERYPYLAGGKPEELPNMPELQKISRDAVIVSTADPFHHGIGYGDAPEDALPPNAEGIARARASIEEGIALLEQRDYWGYNQHCVTAKSDARDAGQVFTYLRGPLRGKIIDMAISDATELYGSPAPTWVAAPLVSWTPALDSIQ